MKKKSSRKGKQEVKKKENEWEKMKKKEGMHGERGGRN